MNHKWHYDKNGNLLNVWKYAKECTDFYSNLDLYISRGNLSKAAKFNTETNKKFLKLNKGFVFSFSSIQEKFIKIIS